MIFSFPVGIYSQVDLQRCFLSSDPTIYAVLMIYYVTEKNPLQFLQVS